MVMQTTYAIGPLSYSATDRFDFMLREYRFGGQAVSLAVNYTHKAEFAAAGYAPFMVDGTEYGETRQYGNFSFLRVYEVCQFHDRSQLVLISSSPDTKFHIISRRRAWRCSAESFSALTSLPVT